MTASTRATRKYLQTLRGVSVWDKTWLDQGVTPRSLPPHLLVKQVEFVRARDFPHKGHELCDYRVHFEDGTYDCVTYAVGVVLPIEGKYCSRLAGDGAYAAWREDDDEPPKPEIRGFVF